MYHLLIEAGGLQQLQRVNPEWSDTFSASLQRVASEHGFVEVTRESDWLLFAWETEHIPESEAVARYIQAVDKAVEHESDTLLGYSLVVDFIDGDRGGPASRLAKLLAALRRTDRERGTWLTAAAYGGIEPFVETTPVGPLFLVNGYTMERNYGLSDYDSAVSDPSFRRALLDRLGSTSGGGYAGRIVVRGDDLQQLVGNTGAACTEYAGITTPIVWWRDVPHHDDRAELDLAFLLAVRDDERRSRINGREEHARLAEYRRRFEARSNVYLSPGWRSGELRVAAGLMAEFLARETRPIVIVVNSQSLPEEARAELGHLLPHQSPVIVVECVQATGPVSAGGAEVTLEWKRPEWVTGEPRDETISATYWRELARERGGVPSVPGGPGGTEEALAALLATFDKEYAAALWVWFRSQGVLTEAIVDALFPACGISLAERSRIREESRRNGIVPNGCGLDLSPALTWSTLEGRLVDSLASLRDRYSAALLELIESGQCNLTPAVWALVRSDAPRPVRFSLWHRLVHSLAAGGAPDIVEAIIAPERGTDRVMDASALSAVIRSGLRDSRSPTDVADDATRLSAISGDESFPQQVRIDALLTCGEYDLATRAYENALKHAKGAMYLSQSEGPGGTATSHLLMARTMLARRRVADAGSYLNYARELAEGRDRATLFVATVFELIRLFLHGNLSGVERGATALEPSLRDAGFTEWLVQVGFLRGRVAFELGDYDAARERFVDLARFCVDCGMHAPGSVTAAWELRASGFQGRPLEELTDSFAMLGRRPEAMLFAAEAKIRAGEFQAALETLDEVVEVERDKVWWPRLGVCWTDGFAAVEDALLATEPGDSMLSRLAGAYRALALANCERGDEAVALFHALTREMEGLLHDPYGGFYNYLYSTILPEEGRRDRDDRLTVLSRAVKFVQERNSRIEDYHDKVRFLQANDWNRRLMEAARGHNLV